MRHSKLVTLLQGFANVVGIREVPPIFAPRADYKRMARRKFNQEIRTAGNKIARECYQGRATMRHPDGVISATLRDLQQRKYLGKA